MAGDGIYETLNARRQRHCLDYIDLSGDGGRPIRGKRENERDGPRIVPRWIEHRISAERRRAVV